MSTQWLDNTYQLEVNIIQKATQPYTVRLIFIADPLNVTNISQKIFSDAK